MLAGDDTSLNRIICSKFPVETVGFNTYVKHEHVGTPKPLGLVSYSTERGESLQRNPRAVVMRGSDRTMNRNIILM